MLQKFKIGLILLIVLLMLSSCAVKTLDVDDNTYYPQNDPNNADPLDDNDIENFGCDEWDGFANTAEPSGEGCVVRSGDWIYYTDYSESGNATTLNRVKTDGSKKELILNIPNNFANDEEVFISKEYWKLQIYDNTLYVTDVNDDELTNGSGILKFDLSKDFPQQPEPFTVPKGEIMGCSYTYLQFTANGIYVVDGAEERDIYFLSRDGKTYDRILRNVGEFVASDDYLVYSKEDLSQKYEYCEKLYKCLPDGSDREIIEDEYYHDDYAPAYIAGGCLFYNGEDGFTRYDLSDNSKAHIEIVEDDEISKVVSGGNNILFLQGFYTVYVLPEKTEYELKKLPDFENITDISVVDDWLFVEKYDSTTPQRIRISDIDL